MKAQEWRQHSVSVYGISSGTPEMEHFYFGQTNSGAGANLSFAAKPYACQRRHNWPQVAANCPEFDVKQRILRTSMKNSLRTSTQRAAIWI